MNSIITLENISVHQNNTYLLKNIDWEIKKNEHWALIGPNGSGKTTLLKIVSGYLWPSSGTVHVLGKEFGKTDIRQLRKHIGWVSSYLIEKIPLQDSVLNIVISGKYASFGVFEQIQESDKTQAKELLSFLDCSSIIDKPVQVLSQGEKQKLLLARALMAKPTLLLLDEPCTGLDPKAREHFLKSISKICQENKTTVIFITHHYEEIVEEIDKVLMLKEGKVFKRDDKKVLLKETVMNELFH